MSIDKLDLIVKRQVSFQTFMGFNIPKLTEQIKSKENVETLSFFILALYDELSEALHCLPWKPWKKQQEFKLDLFWGELIDIFHFLVNLFIFSGMTPEIIHSEFIKKNNINFQRQKDGY